MHHAADKPYPIFLLSYIALLILAYFSVGYNHPDEHFQILEFAALKLHLTKPEFLPWEYHARMRPALQPAIVVCVHKVFSVFGCTNPFSVALFLRILSGTLSFAAMWMIYRRYAGEVREPLLRKWFLLLSFLLWFALYNNVRFSSETWSGDLFVIGFAYLFVLSRQPLIRDFLLTGVLVGSSFILRYQAGFIISGFLAWMVFVRKERFMNILYMVVGIQFVVLAGIVIDRWYYGDWTLTAWNYFYQNILADKVSGFGIHPWYFYLEEIFIRVVPPFSLALIIGFILFMFFRPKDILTWTLLPFILAHFMIGHKETRFFYPLIGFIPVIMIRSIEIVREKWNGRIMEDRFFQWFAKSFWVVNVVFIGLAFFNPADSQVRIYEEIYTRYPGPVTLYYLDENPYSRALDIHYYRSEYLSIRKARSVDQLNADTSCKFLLAVKSGNRDVDNIKNKRLIGSSFPDWIKKFNFNHWVERTAFWNVYEIENRDKFAAKY